MYTGNGFCRKHRVRGGKRDDHKKFLNSASFFCFCQTLLHNITPTTPIIPHILASIYFTFPVSLFLSLCHLLKWCHTYLLFHSTPFCHYLDCDGQDSINNKEIASIELWWGLGKKHWFTGGGLQINDFCLGNRSSSELPFLPVNSIVLVWDLLRLELTRFP